MLTGADRLVFDHWQLEDISSFFFFFGMDINHLETRLLRLHHINHSRRYLLVVDNFRNSQSLFMARHFRTCCNKQFRVKPSNHCNVVLILVSPLLYIFCSYRESFKTNWGARRDHSWSSKDYLAVKEKKLEPLFISNFVFIVVFSKSTLHIMEPTENAWNRRLRVCKTNTFFLHK